MRDWAEAALMLVVGAAATVYFGLRLVKDILEERDLDG